MAEQDENAYEKLSREVHQAQITGAIHQDWLENPCGLLLKPDFKRKMQKMGAGGKKLIQTSLRGLRWHLPGNTYRSRWFVLDGMMLRYFRSKSDDQELGSIHLSSVNAVLPSSIADAPEHALDLVCADRIYTIAATTREDMVRWATVLTLVLRGEYQPKMMQRRESAVIRGSSVIPPHSRLSYIRQPSQIASHTPSANSFHPVLAAFDEEMDDREHEMDEKLRVLSVREKIVTVTFDSPGSLHLLLQSTMDDAIVVKGFHEPAEGGVGLAEATGAIKVGDLLVCIQDHSLTSTTSFDQAVQEIQVASRPLTLRFSRLEVPPTKHQQRVAQGWVLAKEPATTRCRTRLLQLQGSKVLLYKPGMHSGHLDHPCVAISLDDVSDFRVVHDKRKAPGDAKEFGLTLEGKEMMLTFYVQRPAELWHWLDLLKNAPLFDKSAKTYATIPVHPLTIIEQPPKRTTIVLEGDGIMKLGDLSPTFEPRTLQLHAYGKLAVYRGDVRVGTVQCDTIQDISLSKFQGQWYLELIAVLPASDGHKYRREVVLRFDSEQQGIKWTRAIERVAKQCLGPGEDIDVTIETVDEWTPPGQPLQNDVSDATYASLQAEWSASRHLGELKLEDKAALTQGWFFVKQPGMVGREAYHSRYVVLREHCLYLYKYQHTSPPNDGATSTMCASTIDLSEIQDVVDGNPSLVETMEHTIQLQTASHVVFTLVALTCAQKNAWLALLVWTSDYYCVDDDQPLAALKSGAAATTPDSDQYLPRLSFESNPPSPVGKAAVWDAPGHVRGWIKLDSLDVYACIVQGVFSCYESEEDMDAEWGDAVHAIPLAHVRRVYADNDDTSLVVTLDDDAAAVRLTCRDKCQVKTWMLAICSCSHLVLSTHGGRLESQPPHEGWIWKLDPLFQVHRKRFFCLKNHELVMSTASSAAADHRVLAVVPLDAIVKLFMSKVTTTGKDTPLGDYFQLTLQCDNGADDDDDEAAVHTLSLSFFDESDMKTWATAIFHCCTNATTTTPHGSSASLSSSTTIKPPTSVAVFPQELMKTSRFLESEDRWEPFMPGQARGWLYYRTSSTKQRLRRRYFVQYGSELSIYKHELLSNEPSAIRYGVLDCRALVDVRFITTQCPENALALEFAATTLVLVAESDAATLAWRALLLDVKRTFNPTGSRRTDHGGVLISRSSTFQNENEALLRNQIEQSVQFAANMHEWDGSKWVANYFVLTGSRLLVFSLAVHLYDEDPDVLSTYPTTLITSVRSVTDDDGVGDVLHGQSPPLAKTSFVLGFGRDVNSKLILKCETVDLCLQLMRLLCLSNGKLELKQSAATGSWGRYVFC
ncbi:hypothetical protein, variant 2 [Aphanomyces astaci]|uniref:PH domain-containing protein n=1 Tax=Aphanomyces astaci TaxID=112090 RepID=W4GYZ8_APHAT|nr:hypothetical protein, variant 2 [Aphanomyces astaci]ETV84138.1 hypothetical protein, variant 2 [Aphanomyces astaci]|eukprot:XP_009825834.1 hypothetical protein, variant 2 [Aphanomyces astaci]